MSFAAAQMGARRARTTLELVADSLALTRDGWKELLGIVALGVVPGTLLVFTTAFLAGFHDPDTLALILAGEEPGRLVPVAAASVLARVLGVFTTLALLVACDARDRGAPVVARAAWRRALGLWRPFLSAFGRLLLSALAWTLLFVLPGMAVFLRGAFFAQAVVVENLEGSQAVARSRRLVSRAPGYLLGNLLGSALIAGGAAFTAVFALHVALAAPAAFVPTNGNPLDLELVAMLDRLLAGAVGAWAAAFSVLLYKDAAAAQ